MPVSDYAPLFEAAGKQYNVSPDLLRAVSSVESGGNPRAVSPAGALGLMQLMPDTAKALGVTDPYDVTQAIPAAAKLLAENLDRYGTPDKALMAYNAGTDPSRWNNPETQGYVPKIIAAFKGSVMPSASAAEPTGGKPFVQAPPAASAQQVDAFSAAFGAPKAPAASDGVTTITVTPHAPAEDANGHTPAVADALARAAQASATPGAPAASGAPADGGDAFSAVFGGGAAPQSPAAPASAAPASAAAPAPSAPQPAASVPSAPSAAAQPPVATSTPAQPSWLERSLNTTAGTLNAITHGLSMGLDAPLNALYSHLSPDYARMHTGDAAAQQQFAQEHPIAAPVAEIAGSVPTYLAGEGALARAIPALAGGGMTAKVVNPLLAGVRNATLGGASAYGLSGGDPYAAGTGAAIGAVLPPALNATFGVANRLASPLVNRTMGGAANSAAAKVATAIARDQMTPDEVAARLKELGPNAAMVDAGGANLRGLGETVANMPGAPAQQAQTFLEDRASGQASRLNDAVKAATGSSGDFHAALDDLAKSRASDAAPKYEAAFSQSPVTSKEIRPLQAFIQDPIGQDALQRGLRIVQLEKLAEGKTFDPAVYGVKPAQNGGFIIDPGQLRTPDGKLAGSDSVPSLRMLDAVKRGYDDIVEGFRDPTTGRLNLNQYGRAVNNVRASFVSQLKEMYPAYADALNAWSGPSKAMDALSMGRRTLSADPEVTAKAISGLSDADKDFFKAGVARALKDKIESAQDGADATRRIFGNQLIRDKIAAAFNDPAAFAKFQKTMEQEATFANTRNQVLKGSQTARRLAGQDDQGIDLIGPAFHAVTGNPGHAAMSIFKQAANAMMRPPAKQGAQLGNMLFTPGDNTPVMNALTRAGQPPPMRQLTAPVSILGVNRMLAPQTQP